MTVDTSVAEVSVAHELGNKHLIDEQLWNRLVARIVRDQGMEVSLAERILDQTLAFLTLVAKGQSGPYVPSKLVDIGWHTFLLYTEPYAAFCQRVAGWFIHHEPSDLPGVTYRSEEAMLPRTVAAMKALGLTVDEALWVGKANCPCGCCSPSGGGH